MCQKGLLIYLFVCLFITCEKKNFFASMLVCLFVQTFVCLFVAFLFVVRLEPTVLAHFPEGGKCGIEVLILH